MKNSSKATLSVYYDEGCGPCTTIARLIDRFNWFGHVRFLEAAEYPEKTGDEYVDIHSIDATGAVFQGYETYQQLAWRIPILWPVAPFMYLPPVAWLGQEIYRRIADSRTCRLDD